ncbi:hypothetical protein [Haloplanus pelagicus]|jgi:hypothetical protein|uniref:hypothetical protein n=1 Tax=Haloplanus pelagicus TaxID=2949995 RepID=UPI00203C15C8|nr:hypothetical protein [Haloplanus sp. HW8-1]
MPDSTQAEVRSNWWMANAATVVWLLLLYVLVVLQAFVFEASRAAALLAVQGWLFVYLVFSIAALFGFYYDAAEIVDAGRDWHPYWWLYVVASFLFTPSFTSFVYLVQRGRHIGLYVSGRKFGPTV